MTEKKTNIFLNAEDTLKKYWGYDTFRHPQREIIENVINGNDTLAIMPTGGGKSVCFQIPGLLLPGVCVVVSPLIALMKDQVSQLEARGIKATAIYAGIDGQSITEILNDAIDQKLKFLYVSPERLQTLAFQNALKHLKIGLLAIDEAHCISKWGYDFRPAYLQITEMKNYIFSPDFPTIALTATATDLVKTDIIEKLQLKRPQVFIKSFARDNLAYHVIQTDLKENVLLQYIKKHPGSGIIYTRTRKRTEEISSFLNKNQVVADFYHAGLGINERNKKQISWIKDPYGIMVATNAFGMGIDKPDVRVVIHADLCDNLEAYYQESGRAGRDGKQCSALLLYNETDIATLEKNLEKKYPEISFIKKIYQNLANYFQVAAEEQNFILYDFDLFVFCSTFGLDVLQTHYALKILENQNLIFLSESYFQPSKIRFLVSHEVLSEFQEKNKDLEALTKAILRIYGGEVFSSYVTVKETEISSATKAGYSKTVEGLNLLKKYSIIDYSPQKSLPQFSFMDFRYDINALPLKHKDIQILKSNDKRALKAIINYAEQDDLCRMTVIQDYFDEKKPKPCGKCDVCLTNNKAYSDINPFEIKTKLISLMPSTLSGLESSFDSDENQIVKRVLKAGLSSGEFKFDAFGLIFVAN